MARIITLIYTEERVGIGTHDDPVRLRPQLWTKDGELIAELDSHDNKSFFTPKNL